MVNVRHAVDAEVTVQQLIPSTRVTDATPVTHTDVDVRTFKHETRFLLLLEAFETNVANTGGTWSVTESETDGGAYTAADTHGSLAATGATPGNVQRVVSFRANPAKPFVLVTFTGADANAEVDITATLVALPNVL
jgi:hypothetical protein